MSTTATPALDRAIQQLCCWHVEGEDGHARLVNPVTAAHEAAGNEHRLHGPVGPDGRRLWSDGGYCQRQTPAQRAALRALPAHPGVVEVYYRPAPGEPCLCIGGNRAARLPDVLNIVIHSGSLPGWITSMDYSGSYRYCWPIAWSSEVVAILLAAASEVKAERSRRRRDGK